jgi:hypothetical protein
MGALILAGLALDGAGLGSQRAWRLTAAMSVAGIAISQLASQLRVLALDNPMAPLVKAADWPVPATISVAALTLAGALAFGSAIAAGRRPAPRQPVRAHEAEARVGG